MSVKLSAVMFVLFVVVAQCVPFTILALASSSSGWSAAILETLRASLQRNKRVITVIFGVLFGTWVLLKALARLDLI